MEEKRIGSWGKYEIWLGLASTILPDLTIEPYIYNREEHLATQNPINRFSVWVWDSKARQMVALLRGDYHKSDAYSLTNAPFGGLQYLSGLSPEVLKHMLDCIEKWCISHGITRLTIKAPPDCYNKNSYGLLKELYENCGLQISKSYINLHLPVSPEDFIHKISAAERRRLRKCQRAGFTHGLWENPNPTNVYGFLAACRSRKGYSLPMDFAGFLRLLTQLPEYCPVFMVKDGEKLISLTIAIRVNSRILYNFCPVDDLDYRTFSPAVMLNAALYEYAQKEGIELIDLGISLDQLGNEKASLLRFKKNIGGQESMKLIYQKELL